MLKLKKHYSGFTLIEILIAMALITFLTLFALDSLTPWLAFKQRLETDKKLRELQDVFQTIYKDNAFVIDSNQDLTGKLTIVLPGDNRTTDFIGNMSIAGDRLYCQATNQAGIDISVNEFDKLHPYFLEGVEDKFTDGFKNVLCVGVTPRLPAAGNTGNTFNGLTIYYHNIILVSLGKAGAEALGAGGLVPAQYDSTSGSIIPNEGSGLIVKVISGYSVERSLFEKTASNLTKVGDAYEAYFKERFLANIRRDSTVDYFAGIPSGLAAASNFSWDQGCSAADLADPLKVSLCQTFYNTVDAPRGYNSFNQNDFGLSEFETTSAWVTPDIDGFQNRNKIYYDNAGSNVPGSGATEGRCWVKHGSIQGSGGDTAIIWGVSSIAEANSLDGGDGGICPRSPSQAGALGNTPPYSVILGVDVPGNQVMLKSVVGKF